MLDMLDKEQLKDVCEKLFKGTVPIVDKDEARAGVLGFHPLALLVIATDIIDAQDKDFTKLKQQRDDLLATITNARLSIKIMSMPRIDDIDDKVASNEELLAIMGDSFEAAIKKGQS